MLGETGLAPSLESLLPENLPKTTSCLQLQTPRAAELLKGCRGHLHADGYSGFNRLYEPAMPGAEPLLIEVACLAHARR